MLLISLITTTVLAVDYTLKDSGDSIKSESIIWPGASTGEILISTNAGALVYKNLDDLFLAIVPSNYVSIHTPNWQGAAISNLDMGYKDIGNISNLSAEAVFVGANAILTPSKATIRSGNLVIGRNKGHRIFLDASDYAEACIQAGYLNDVIDKQLIVGYGSMNLGRLLNNSEQILRGDAAINIGALDSTYQTNRGTASVLIGTGLQTINNAVIAGMGIGRDQTIDHSYSLVVGTNLTTHAGNEIVADKVWLDGTPPGPMYAVPLWMVTNLEERIAYDNNMYSNYIEDTFVHESGDTMTGDLVMSNSIIKAYYQDDLVLQGGRDVSDEAAKIILEAYGGSVQIIGGIGDGMLSHGGAVNIASGNGAYTQGDVTMHANGGGDVIIHDVIDPTVPKDAVNLRTLNNTVTAATNTLNTTIANFTDNNYVNVSGDTMTGSLVMDGAASADCTIKTPDVRWGGYDIAKTLTLESGSQIGSHGIYTNLGSSICLGGGGIYTASSVTINAGEYSYGRGSVIIHDVIDPADPKDAVNLQTLDNTVTAATNTLDTTLRTFTDNNYVNVSGDIMTGNLIVSNAIIQALNPNTLSDYALNLYGGGIGAGKGGEVNLHGGSWSGAGGAVEILGGNGSYGGNVIINAGNTVGMGADGDVIIHDVRDPTTPDMAANKEYVDLATNTAVAIAIDTAVVTATNIANTYTDLNNFKALENVIWVAKSGGDFDGIAEAVDAAEAGDTILIAPGAYDVDTEIVIVNNITIKGLSGTKHIVLTSTVDGSLFRLDNGAVFVLENVTISSTHAGNGGGIYAANGSGVEINNCNFDNCGSTSGSGGGIYAANGSDVEINNCNFDTCVSTSGSGGGIYANNSEINNCNFDNCSTSGNGGGIYANNSEINNCTFDDCRSNYSYGGGIYATTDVKIDNCNFDSCSSGGGGGVYATTDVKIDNCNFDSCSSSSSGGGIYATTDVKIDNCTFDTCTGGGGIYATTNVKINNCTFDSCVSYSDGGGIFANNSEINNCNFNGCNSSSGGGIFADNSEINNCNFDTCVSTSGSGGGIFADNSEINNCNFDTCSSSMGGRGGIYGNSTSSAYFCVGKTSSDSFVVGTYLSCYKEGALVE